jgi:hypothetical protein
MQHDPFSALVLLEYSSSYERMLHTAHVGVHFFAHTLCDTSSDNTATLSSYVSLALLYLLRNSFAPLLSHTCIH